MTSPADRLSAALTGRYRIERELGAGGMATVYLAHDDRHDRPVALKLLRPELAAVIGADRFLAEIKVTANLQHPHILPLHDSGEADGFLFYVMPYVEGESLRDRLNREQQLPIADSVRIAAEVASALDYAHRQGVVHRDIKPENILLHDGRALVADFGIALAATNTVSGRMTETGMSLGTPQYMSPEQAMGQRDVTAKSDVYALGSVAYEMLVGEPPFTGPSAQAIVARIVTEEPRGMRIQRSTIPPNVEAAVRTALSKLPADRFATAAAFADALQNPAFAQAGAVGAAPTAGPETTRKRSSRWILTAVIVAVTLIAGATAGLVFGKRGLIEPPVVRFPLTLAPGFALWSSAAPDAPFALSPDGRFVVFVAVRDSGSTTRQLYIRALDQAEWTALPGTETAVAPFFSFDGKWVGFFSAGVDGPLKKVPVTGGPPVTLSDKTTNRPSASWGDDNFVVYDDGRGRLSRVNGAGGTPKPIPVTGDSDRLYYWPAVLPGGKSVLAERCNLGCARHDLVAVDVASGKDTVLVPGATRGWYLRDGHLLYASEDRAVYSVTFDANRLRVTGEPIPVLEGVQSGQFNSAQLTIAVITGTMAYMAGGEVVGNRRVVAVDRAGKERTVIAQPGSYTNPRWSPDGKRIVVQRTDKTGSQIWIDDLASGTASQLTHDGTNSRPSWSPDGKRVVFSNTGGGPVLEWMPVDGSQPPQGVVEGPEVTNGPATSWTRDGNWIIIDGLVAASGTHEAIYAVPTTGKRAIEPVVQSEGNVQTGSVSPDGKWIAYVSDESEGKFKVYVRPFRTAGGRFQISTGLAQEALWVSSHELAYVDVDTHSLVLADLSFGPTVQVLKRTALFDVAKYTLGGPGFWNYDVSHDGREFLFVRAEQSAQVSQLPIAVLNWGQEIKRKTAEQGGKR